jgi:phosphoribosylglycinamide formyltransferase-1
MKKLKVGVLISGRGSNLRALIEACAQKDFPAEIGLVISNVADAGGLKYAAEAGIPTIIVEHKDFPSREAFDNEMDAELKKARVGFVCLAGFMRLLSTPFVKEWEGKIVNIHPSLLPAFKGLNVHEQVLDAGVRISGCTVHYVVPELDAGPPIVQAAVPVEPHDNADTLAARVLEAEHRIYPEALKMIAENRIRLENGRAVFA